MTLRRETDRLYLAALAAAFFMVLLAGCGKKEAAPAPAPAATQAPMAPMATPAMHVEVRTGKSVGADKRVGEPVTTFAAADTIYASATIHGRNGEVAVRALWTYEDGQTVSDDTQTITADGGATAEFHISKPDGFPAGGYSVEIFVDGASQGKSSFTVQ
jgi:hypothetical protein